MVLSSWTCMVLSSSAQASRNHAVHRRTTSTSWLLSTTEARTVSVQCFDVLLLETVNAYQSFARLHRDGDSFGFVRFALLLTFLLCCVNRCLGSWVSLQE